MKKTVVLFLCVIMSVLLASCVNLPFPDTPVETQSEVSNDSDENTDTDTVQTTEPSSLEYSITPMREEDYSYTDMTGTDYDIGMRIPCIEMDSTDASSVNEEINETYSELFDQLEDSIDGGYSTFIYGLDYEYWECNGILSVMIKTMYDGGSVVRDVYNFDLSNGNQIGNDEIVQILSLDSESVFETLRTATQTHYEQLYDIDVDDSSDMRDVYESSLAETISDGNLSQAEYFVCNDTLSAVVRLYTIAGSGQALEVIFIQNI